MASWRAKAPLFVVAGARGRAILQRAPAKSVRVRLLPMRSPFFVAPAAILGLCLVLAPAFAQNETPPNAPPLDAPLETPLETPPQNPPFPGDNALPDEEKPPPAEARDGARQQEMQRQRELQRAAQRQQRRAQVEARLRAIMADFGLKDEIKQDALISYLAEDEAGKTTVRGAASRLLTALKRGATPQRTRDLMGVYKGAIDADKERRIAAQKSLDAKIGYSLDPRLEATLWLFGFLGDGTPAIALGLPRPPENRNSLPPDYRSENRVAAQLPRRTGVVLGTVAAKGDDWIEIQNFDGTMERFSFPVAPNQLLNEGGDNPVLQPWSENLLQTAIGAPVRIEWNWNGRKWATKLEPWTSAPAILGAAPQNPPADAPKKNWPKPAPTEPIEPAEPTQENPQP